MRYERIRDLTASSLVDLSTCQNVWERPIWRRFRYQSIHLKAVREMCRRMLHRKIRHTFTSAVTCVHFATQVRLSELSPHRTYVHNNIRRPLIALNDRSQLYTRSAPATFAISQGSAVMAEEHRITSVNEIANDDQKLTEKAAQLVGEFQGLY